MFLRKTMESNNFLDSLLKVQDELKNTVARLDALESGSVAPHTVVLDRTAPATIGDFLSRDDILAINRSFSDELNRTIECDSLDYALACACGVISGLIDILLVKTPHEGIIGDASDKLFDKALIELAGEKRSIASAIGFFEEKAKITYTMTSIRLFNAEYETSLKIKPIHILTIKE